MQVRIEADSISPRGDRLTTFVATYPRYIHAQVNTHRLFSRNASSSRAIPTSKLIEKCDVTPEKWLKNQKGMQGGKELDPAMARMCKYMWNSVRKHACEAAQELADIGVHKQTVNRLLEPFSNITTIITATDWENWFALRCGHEAQPEIHELAWAMADLYYTNEPKPLEDDEWHTPFVKEGEHVCGSPDGVTCSVARCARVSYLNHDGTLPDTEKDKALASRLLADGHMSPFEHQAKPHPEGKRSGNFKGWIQHRKLFPQETRTFDYQAARAAQGR